VSLLDPAILCGSRNALKEVDGGAARVNESKREDSRRACGLDRLVPKHREGHRGEAPEEEAVVDGVRGRDGRPAFVVFEEGRRGDA
jgi:hypothetical protein